VGVQVIHRRRFGWKAFARAVAMFAAEVGLEEAFPVVDDGRVVFGQEHEELELEHVPGDPLRRLEAGLAVYAAFTAFENPRRFACADGGVIAVPGVDDDGVAPPHSDERQRLAERTECGEWGSYGFLISLLNRR
jgi:hypothetical protein